jgi:hypothetical protein
MTTRPLAILLALAAGGCSGTFRGFDTDADIHLHATYYLARTAGFEPETSLKIAAANCFTDFHPDTTSVATERRLAGGLANPISIPHILLFGCADWVSGRESLARGMAGRTAEITSWVLSPLGTRLHFPARELHDAVKPAFARDPATGEILYNNRDSMAVLERAFVALDTRDPDVERTLALLGVGLHTMQDSLKHAGFSPARGHIGADPDPDDLSLDVDLCLEIAEATLHSLLHARRILRGRAEVPGEGWKAIVRAAYETPLGAGESRESRWIALIRATFGDDYGPWAATRGAWGAPGEEAFERAIERIRGIWR